MGQITAKPMPVTDIHMGRVGTASELSIHHWEWADKGIFWLTYRKEDGDFAPPRELGKREIWRTRLILRGARPRIPSS